MKLMKLDGAAFRKDSNISRRLFNDPNSGRTVLAAYRSNTVCSGVRFELSQERWSE
jgi:hypothetical protein